MNQKHLVNFILFLNCLISVKFEMSRCNISDILPPTGCTYNYEMLVCNGTVPHSLPTHISVVHIYAVDFQHYENSPFDNPSWTNVTHLEVLPDETVDGEEIKNKKYFTLRHKTFYYLKNLRHLRFSSNSLKIIDEAAFYGLGNLNSLDLSMNTELGLKYLKLGFSGSNFTKLTACSFRKLGHLSTQRNMFDGEFFDVFQNSPLLSLDLSYIDDAIMDIVSFSRSFPLLESLSLEGSVQLGGQFMFILYSIATGNNEYFRNCPMCLNLKEVNFNYVSIHTVIRENLNDVPSRVDVKKVPNNFKKLHLKGCLPSDRSPQLSIETSEEDTVIVKLSFRPSTIQWIFSFPADFINNLEFIDLSENELEHISMDLKGMSKLKTINVSKNKLFLMNTDTLIITFDLPELEELLASYNELGQVPRDIFTRTPKLAIIDLSHNKLSRISFKIEHLKLLKRLDVSYNNIKSVGDETRFSLSNIIQSRSSFVSNLTDRNYTTFQLNIAGNPIECSCSSLEFLKWAMFQHFIVPQMLTCSLEGKIHVIDTDTVGELEEACKLPIAVVIGSTIGGVTCLLLIFAVFILFKRYRQHKKRRILQNRIQNYIQKNEEKEPFPVFLSYSSKNSDFILKYILPELNRRLKERLKVVDTDCVALGDYNFVIGRQVPDEMIRCIENSSVIIFCVSRDFCESRWCKEEVLVAHYENKPMVLMFLEQVQVKTMPKVLQKLYNRQTRARWTQNENEDFILIPSWDKFCDSLLEIIVQETNN